MSCTTHKDCSAKKYCTVKNTCANFAECNVMQDGIHGSCPDLARAPKPNCSGCNTVEYCKEDGGCYCASDTCYPRKIAGQDVCADAELLAALEFPECN